jgi:hypothetical protein
VGPAAESRHVTNLQRVFVSLTRVKTSDQPLENAAIVADEMRRWLREIEGFEGLVMLSREGTTIGLTFWQNREIADRHRTARMQFVKRMASVVDVEIEEMLELDVMFADVGPLMVNFASSPQADQAP